MNRIKVIIPILSIAVGFSIWYTQKYGMDEVISYQINLPSAEKKVLIATQKSIYKDTLVTYIIDKLRPTKAYINIIDISKLSYEETELYDNIIIIHTWEIWKAPQSVIKYIENHKMNNTFVIGTSGSGDLQLPNIDGISSASIISEIPSQIEKFDKWYNTHNR